MTFGQIETQSGIIFVGGLRVIGVKDVFRVRDAFAVVRNKKVAQIFSFPGRNNYFVAARMFNGVKDNITDDGIQTIVFPVDAKFAGKDFELNTVGGAIGLVIFTDAFEKMV